ncbi:hypothetical protein ASG11_12350 [Sphingomonas sp. Leaf357]|nr:hypothetical protein ASG11_12350 [Sphingomonas sp. Leaf357]
MGGNNVDIANVAKFDTPWAVNFLPDGRMLVTEAFDGIRLVTQLGVVSAPLAGLPESLNVPFDVVASPNFATDRTIFLSFAEVGPGGTHITRTTNPTGPQGLAVLVATLNTPTGGVPSLSNVRVIWRQSPLVVALGEYGGKLAFSPDGKYLYITAGDRSTFTPAQSLENSIGKTLRIFPDGSIPPDNPGVGKPGVSTDIYSLGHRNSYGIAFDATGQLWESEHGPKGGDELNYINSGSNYGWPSVSLGDNYDGGLIPKPSNSDPFVQSATSWTPAIAPAGMIFYTGGFFPTLKSNAILGGLQAKGLVIVKVAGLTAAEVDRLPLNARIRDVRQAPDGSIWVLEDAPTGRLLRLTPAG